MRNSEHPLGGSSARETDLLFLTGINDSMEATENGSKSISELRPTATTSDFGNLLDSITVSLSDSTHPEKELKQLLSSRRMKQLASCHDKIVASEHCPKAASDENEENVKIPQIQPDEEFIKTAGINKRPGVPLGLSVVDRGNDIIIHRVIVGSFIDKLGLLKRGYVIRSVNNQFFENAAELQDFISKTNGSLVFKLAVKLDTEEKQKPVSTPFVRAYFSYRPDRDSLLPKKNVGVGFESGDVLIVHDKSDKLYWQAENIRTKQTGLIPSEWLEERRRTKKIQKEAQRRQITKETSERLFSASKSQEFDRCDCQIYESVARMPPFKRKMLILIGAIGVGREAIAKRLIATHPEQFGRPRPDTTRQDISADKYNLKSQDEINLALAQREYVEFGQYDGHFFGTRMKSIQDVISQNKICVLDTNPWTLRYLKTPQFMPYVVFIKSPSFETLKAKQKSQVENGWTSVEQDDSECRRIVLESERLSKEYAHYFDSSLVNDNFDETFRKLLSEIERLSVDHQWVPVSWVF